MNFQGGKKRKKKKAVNEDGELQAPLVLCVEPLRALTDMQWWIKIDQLKIREQQVICQKGWLCIIAIWIVLGFSLLE